MLDNNNEGFILQTKEQKGPFCLLSEQSSKAGIHDDMKTR